MEVAVEVAVGVERVALTRGVTVVEARGGFVPRDDGVAKKSSKLLLALALELLVFEAAAENAAELDEGRCCADATFTPPTPTPGVTPPL